MDCSICLEIINCNQITIPCGHRFHANCLNIWKTNHKSCPLCRLDLDFGDDLYDTQGMSDDTIEYLKSVFQL